MAGDEVEVAARLRRRLEEDYGMREAAYLMDRPAGGWDSLATKADLAALRAEFRDETTRLLKWIVPTIFAGVAAMGAIAGAVGGIVAGAG